MSQCILGPCLILKRNGKSLVGLVGTLVDDTIACGNSEFSELENPKSSASTSKHVKICQHLVLAVYRYNDLKLGLK